MTDSRSTPGRAACPDRRTRQLERLNRWRAWRADPGGWVLNVISTLAAVGVLGWAAWPALRRLALLEPTPSICGALGLAWALLAGVDLGRRDRALRVAHQSGWLAATPWPAALRLRARRLQVMHAALGWSLVSASLYGLLTVLRPAAYPVWVHGGVLAAVLLLPSVAWLASGRAHRGGAHRHTPPLTCAWAVSTRPWHRGLALLDAGWQRSAARQLRAPLLVLLMLVPGGLSGRAALGVLLGVAVLLAGMQAWTHYRLSVVQASRWLQALPLSARRLGVALGGALAGRTAILLGLLTGTCAVAGVPMALVWPVLLVAMAAALWLALLVLQYRHHPHRYRLVSTAQGLSLVLCMQGLPWLTPLLWLGYVIRALQSLPSSPRRHR